MFPKSSSAQSRSVKLIYVAYVCVAHEGDHPARPRYTKNKHHTGNKNQTRRPKIRRKTFAVWTQKCKTKPGCLRLGGGKNVGAGWQLN